MSLACQTKCLEGEGAKKAEQEKVDKGAVLPFILSEKDGRDAWRTERASEEGHSQVGT